MALVAARVEVAATVVVVCEGCSVCVVVTGAASVNIYTSTK